MWDEYWSDENKKILKNTGDAASARKFYYKHKPSNLRYLLQKRYVWMNAFLRKNDKVLEVGCGMGVTRDFLRKDIQFTMTDIESHAWVDKSVDAMDTGFPSKSFDAVICSNMIHHVAYPVRYFKEMSRILKPGGVLIIQDVNCSFTTKALLRIFKHEGWSYKRDVFSNTVPVNDPSNPWSGNNAVPNMLFDDGRFAKKIKNFTVVHDKFTEFMIFPISGGVTAKARTINLPFWMLRIVDGIDCALIKLFPMIFSISRQIVLKKR